MNRIKSVAKSTKKFVVDHQVIITIITTALVCGKLNRMVLKEHNDFLKEHDLYEKFYNPE